MKCSNCGNEMPDGTMFCDNCGQKAEIHTQINQKRYCGSCGAEIEGNMDFCGNCGSQIKLSEQTEEKSSVFCGNCGSKIEYGIQYCGGCGTAVGAIQSNETMTNKPVKKKKRIGIVVVAIVVVCIAVAAVAIGYMMYPMYDSTTDNNDMSLNVTATAEPDNKEQASPSVSSSSIAMPESTLASNMKTPVSNSDESMISNRTDLYNSNLTYKRMPDIHDTVLVDDNTFNELKTVIEEFNKQCEDYMNEITEEAPSLLKPGTTAYNQQVEYKQKHPTLNQSYQKIDVINARQGGGYYYVWVTEVININENGMAKEATDHWVYKIENYNGNWYICDYTSDPAF